MEWSRTEFCWREIRFSFRLLSWQLGFLHGALKVHTIPFQKWSGLCLFALSGFQIFQGLTPCVNIAFRVCQPVLDFLSSLPNTTGTCNRLGIWAHEKTKAVLLPLGWWFLGIAGTEGWGWGRGEGLSRPLHRNLRVVGRSSTDSSQLTSGALRMRMMWRRKEASRLWCWGKGAHVATFYPPFCDSFGL